MMLKKPKNTRKTFYISPVDEQAIEAIKSKYGCPTSSDAVRLALRILAENQVRIAKPKQAK